MFGKLFSQKFDQTKQSVAPYLNCPIINVSGLYFPIKDGHINDLFLGVNNSNEETTVFQMKHTVEVRPNYGI